MAGLPLERLQRWLQEVVVHPGEVEAALASPGARVLVPDERDVVLPSATLSPAQRVEIYHRMYLLRMYDALASDYYALEHLLGRQRFWSLVAGYVRAHPSRSFSLNRLGDRLPDYIRDEAQLPRKAFCHDLARLELAVTHVFDAPQTPPLDAERIATVPAEAWETAVLQPVEAFRLMSFRYPVNAYLQSVKDDDHDNHPRARRQDTWLAVYRRDYSVSRLELTRAAHHLLQDLVSGRPLGEAIESTVRVRRRGRDAVDAEQLFGWFREWVAGGVFRSVETPERPSSRRHGD